MAYKPKAGATLSEPNVIPMADIMLVLLIIMMITVPRLQQGTSVDMATVANPVQMKDAEKEDAVLLSITHDGTIFFRTTKIHLTDVTPQVRDALKDRLDKVVYIKADQRAKYGDVTAVVDDVRAAGDEQIGLITEKLTDPAVEVEGPKGGG